MNKYLFIEINKDYNIEINVIFEYYITIFHWIKFFFFFFFFFFDIPFNLCSK